MQVFLQMVAFSLQSDGSGRPVLTKGKRPKTRLFRGPFCDKGLPFGKALISNTRQGRQFNLLSSLFQIL